MGNGMNRVLPGLYVGNYRDSKDPAQLERHRITHIVAIHDGARRQHVDMHYLCVIASDSPGQNLSQYFPLCNDFIHAARLRDGNVLIHCLAGMSRSVTVAVAYIMSVTNLSWKEALKVVRAGRAVANPNQGFQKQLQDFEQKMLTEERRRIKERYPSLALEASDRANCAIMLDSYQSLLSARHICEGQCPMGQPCPTGVCRTGTGKRLFRRRSSSARPGQAPLPATRIPTAGGSRSAGNSPASSRQTQVGTAAAGAVPAATGACSRLLPRTPPCSSEPSSPRRAATGITRSASTISSQRGRSGPSGLYSYTGQSAPPSRSGSRLDVSYTEGGGGGGGSAIVVGGTQWARHRAGSAPNTPLPSPPCSPQHWPRRSATLNKRGSTAT